MRPIFRYIILLAVVSWSLVACEKEGIKEYDADRAAIEFSSNSGA